MTSARFDAARIDARCTLLFDDIVQVQIRRLSKLELDKVWQLTRHRLASDAVAQASPVSAIYLRKRMLDGLAGESLLVASAMFLRNLSEVEAFFDLSLKAIKSRLGGRLDTAASERAMRAARASMTAAEVFGSFDAARAYMHTTNFALGNATPAELVKTAGGERIVLDELHAQAEGAPL